MWIYELYTDNDALGALGGSHAFKALSASIGGFIDGKPVMHFLQEAQTWLATTDAAVPISWVAELGLKFALVRMRFRELPEPDAFTVQAGLELAKHLARDHFRNLAAWLPGPDAASADLAELTPVERRAYLVIVENPGITKADLRRRMRNLSSAGRDAIVVRLLAMGLIRRAGEGLIQNAT